MNIDCRDAWIARRIWFRDAASATFEYLYSWTIRNGGTPTEQSQYRNERFARCIVADSEFDVIKHEFSCGTERGLSFDMRGGRKWAKPACGRPLDGRVRRLVD